MLNGSKHFDGLLPFLRRTLRKQINSELVELKQRLRRAEAAIKETSEQLNSRKKRQRSIQNKRSSADKILSKQEQEKNQCIEIARNIPERLCNKFKDEVKKRRAILCNLPVHEQIAELVWIDTSAARLKGFLNT